MTSDQALALIGEVLARIAPEIDLTTSDLDEPMTREFDLDSMDLLELVEGIAQRADITIPEGEIQSDWSLNDLVADLARR